MQEYEEYENYPGEEIPITYSGRKLSKQDIKNIRLAKAIQLEKQYASSFPAFRPNYYPYLDEEGKVDLSKVSRYDKGAPPMDLYGYYDINKYRAYQQTALEQFGSFLNQAVIGEAVGGTIQAVGSVLALPEVLQGDFDIDNPVYKIGKSLVEWSREATPIYQTGKRFADPGYWFQGMVSAASTASFLIPGGVAYKGVKGLGKLAGLSRTTSEMLGVGASSLMSRHVEGLRESNDLYDRNVEKLNYIWQTGAFSEEAKSKNPELYRLYTEKQRLLQELEVKYDEQGLPIQKPVSNVNTNEIKAIDDKAQSLINTYSNIGARTTYLMDYTNLIFDVIQMGALVKISQKLTRPISKSIPTKLLETEKGVIGMKEIAERSIPKNWWGKTFSTAYRVGEDIFPQVSEGLEEVINEIASAEGERTTDLVSGIAVDDGSTFGERVFDYLGRPETMDAFIFGTLGGVAFQSIGHMVGFGGDKDIVNRKIAETISRDKSLKKVAADISEVVTDSKLSEEAKKSKIQNLAYRTGFEMGINASLNNNMDRVEKHLKSQGLIKDLVSLKMGDEETVSSIVSTIWEGAKAAETNFSRYFSIVRERRISDSGKISLATDLASLHDHVIRMGKERNSIIGKINEFENENKDIFGEMSPLEKLMVKELSINIALKEVQEHGKDITVGKDVHTLHSEMEKYLKDELFNVTEQIRTFEVKLSEDLGSKKTKEGIEQVRESFNNVLKKGLAEYTSVYYLLAANEQVYRNKLAELLKEENQKKYAEDFEKKVKEQKEQQAEAVKQRKYDKNKEKIKSTATGAKIATVEETEEASKTEGVTEGTPKEVSEEEPSRKTPLKETPKEGAKEKETGKEEEVIKLEEEVSKERIKEEEISNKEKLVEEKEEEDVAALFESDPILANKIYTLLGFNCDLDLTEKRKYSINLADENTFYAPVIPLEAIDNEVFEEKNGISFEEFLKSHGKILKISLFEMRGKNFKGRLVGDVRVVGENGTEVYGISGFNEEVLKSVRITPEQKQYAQQVYSQYLKTTSNPTIKGVRDFIRTLKESEIKTDETTPGVGEEEVKEIVKDLPDGVIEKSPYEIIGNKVFKNGKKVENPNKLFTTSEIVLDDLIKDYLNKEISLEDYLRLSERGISDAKDRYIANSKTKKESENLKNEYAEKEQSDSELNGNNPPESQSTISSSISKSSWESAKSPYSIRLAYRATNFIFVEGKPYTVKGQENIPQQYIDLADWTSFPIGTQVEFRPDTEYQGKGYVYENGKRLKDSNGKYIEKEENFSSFIKEGTVDHRNVPIKVMAKYPDGREVTIGYLPTMNFITELDNYDNYKNLLTINRSERDIQKEINRLEDLRYNVINSKKPVVATIDKTPGHILVYHEKDSSGNMRTVAGTISELLPGLIGEDVLKTYYGTDLYPVTIYRNGAFIMANGQGNRSFPKEKISGENLDDIKNLKNGMVVLMLPSAVPGKFVLTTSYSKYMEKKLAGGLTEAVRAGILANSHPEKLTQEHKELIDALRKEGYDITKRAGLKRYLQEFIYVADTGTSIRTSSTIIAFDPSSSNMEIYSGGRKPSKLSLNDYSKIDENLLKLKEALQKVLVGVRVHKTELKNITIPESLEDGKVKFQSYNYMQFMFDHLQTIANEIKNSKGFPVYTVQPTITFSNITTGENIEQSAESKVVETIVEKTTEGKSTKTKKTDIDSFLDSNTPPDAFSDNKFEGDTEGSPDITIEIDESIQETIENVLMEKGVISKDFKNKKDNKLNDEGVICAERGITTTVKGTNWKIVKDFEGQPKHSQGGVDITISDRGVSMRRGGKDIKVAHGLLILK